MELDPVVIHWFRRDLRLEDNHALYHAAHSGYKVQLLFIFDSQIIDELPQNDRRVSLIYNRLMQLNSSLVPFGVTVRIEMGQPIQVFEKVISEQNVVAVYANEDYEPYAIKRDSTVKTLLQNKGVDFHVFTDHLVAHPSQIVKADGKPYTVYTPWSRKWLELLRNMELFDYSVENIQSVLAPYAQPMPSIEALGFINTGQMPNETLPDFETLEHYAQNRDFPALNATSHMSVSLRFGIIGIRQLLRHSFDFGSYVNELGWREFYASILWNFPHVTHRSFKPAYDNIPWRNSEAEFELWKYGQTGYPMVDAGMRQLLETGFMHNRVRMITASFLTKHLLIDWRWGEAWFAQNLIDFELASNNGGWQWAASSGCDAVPYFRIFNPTTQLKRFDSNLAYVRQWIPEIDSSSYPKPIVEHSYARHRAIETYKNALKY